MAVVIKIALNHLYIILYTVTKKLRIHYYPMKTMINVYIKDQRVPYNSLIRNTIVLMLKLEKKSGIIPIKTQVFISSNSGDTTVFI